MSYLFKVDRTDSGEFGVYPGCIARPAPVSVDAPLFPAVLFAR
jgi:hypothetical protein